MSMCALIDREQLLENVCIGLHCSYWANVCNMDAMDSNPDMYYLPTDSEDDAPEESIQGQWSGHLYY